MCLLLMLEKGRVRSDGSGWFGLGGSVCAGVAVARMAGAGFM
jgi:hypothetical protein